MPVLKRKMTINKNKLYIFIILPLIFIQANAMANTVHLESSKTYTEQNTYYIDALFNFNLTDEVLDALLHGIPLEINILFQLRQKRKIYWDKTVNETRLSYRLEHQPLTQDYLTINLQTGLRRSFDNLDAALMTIRSISKLALFNLNQINDNETYNGRIKIYLDLDSLPSPMRPQVYFSDKWNLASDWHEWEINK